MAHYQSFHSHEVTGFLSLSADTAEGEGVVLVDDSDDDQPVDDPAEEEVMELDDTEDNDPVVANREDVAEQDGPGGGDQEVAMEQVGLGDGGGWEGGAAGRRVWLRQRGNELYGQMCACSSLAVPIKVLAEFNDVMVEMEQYGDDFFKRDASDDLLEEDEFDPDFVDNLAKLEDGDPGRALVLSLSPLSDLMESLRPFRQASWGWNLSGYWTAGL